MPWGSSALPWGSPDFPGASGLPGALPEFPGAECADGADADGADADGADGASGETIVGAEVAEVVEAVPLGPTETWTEAIGTLDEYTDEAAIEDAE